MIEKGNIGKHGQIGVVAAPLVCWFSTIAPVPKNTTEKVPKVSATFVLNSKRETFIFWKQSPL